VTGLLRPRIKRLVKRFRSARGEVVGHCELFDESLVLALHLADGLLRNPEGMASFLEAAGPLGLARAGAILDSRVV
jgi:hypothetical protein